MDEKIIPYTRASAKATRKGLNIFRKTTLESGPNPSVKDPCSRLSQGHQPPKETQLRVNSKRIVNSGWGISRNHVVTVQFGPSDAHLLRIPQKLAEPAMSRRDRCRRWIEGPLGTIQ